MVITTKKAIPMLDDFFVRALVAGVGVALIAGPFGCLIVWKRMSYFGDTLAHSGLLGVTLAYMFQINVALSVFVVCATVSILLLFMQRNRTLPTDALLGLLSHSALALGLVAIGFMTWLRVDLSAVLFGDLLSVSKNDILLIYAGGVLLVSTVVWMWKPIFAATVSAELSDAEGGNRQVLDFIFMLLVSLVIAISMQLVGVLLITALLIIPAIAMRPFSTSPEIMVVLASLAGVVSVVLGLSSSLYLATPSGPSIVVAAFGIFIVVHFISAVQKRRRSVS